MEDRIDMMVEQFTLEEIFEECGLTPQEVLDILVREGHMVLPEWIRDREDDGELS